MYVKDYTGSGPRPEDAEEVEGWPEERWDCEEPTCLKKNQKVTHREVVGRADPTMILRLECGHWLM